MTKSLLMVLAVSLILGANAFAGQNAGVAKVAVHVIPHASRSCTKSFPSITGCADIITTEAGPDVDAFPVFFDLVEYQGFDYGVTWPGPYSCVFTSCSDLTIGGIVNTRDGISHAWFVCQPGPVAITGWGWISGHGLVCIVPHPTMGGPQVGDCHQGEPDGMIYNFCAGIGDSVGDDPCAAVATEPTTWGAIKGMYR
jgi:hypothetical protein